MKPFYNVVGAAIVENAKLFAVRRVYGTHSVIQKYEFVGGKVEFGEENEQALRRECMEELDMQVEVGSLLGSVEYEYPEYVVRLKVYLCRRLSGFKLKEHDEQRWIDCKVLDESQWALADCEMIKMLKNGHVAFEKAESESDFETIHELAVDIWHEAYRNILSCEQIDYMVNGLLTPEAIEASINSSEYKYKIVRLNGEPVGFFAYCPAKYYDSARTSGIFLSKLYLSEYARGKHIASTVISDLPRPIVLTVNKMNKNTIAIYKHFGFKIIQNVCRDIGNGYVMDDFVMELN